ncbi:MAG: hypothetical protein M3377_04535, partial [Actinomycetota bacterium]|nr:hypothetical protein [Actinomycetota bacterium]
MPRGVGFAAMAFAVVLAACTGGDDGPASFPEASPRQPDSPTTETVPLPVDAFPAARAIRVPSGFRAEVYARGLEHPTAMAWGPDGRLYVTQDVGSVVAVRPLGAPVQVAGGFDTPLGLAWIGRRLFVSAQGELESLRLRGGRLVARKRIVSDLPYGR